MYLGFEFLSILSLLSYYYYHYKYHYLTIIINSHYPLDFFNNLVLVYLLEESHHLGISAVIVMRNCYSAKELLFGSINVTYFKNTEREIC